MCLWHPFGSHFGGVLGGQMEAKAIKKPPQKNIKNIIPKMNPNSSQRGSQNGAEIVNNEVLEASCFKGGSQVASRAPPGSILERFWDHFGNMFISLSDILLCMHSFAACCKQKTFKITRSHQTNAAESFQETASLFVPSCIEKFTSEG